MSTINPKGESVNDGLAVCALIFGILFWPVGIVLGHVSNRAAKRADRKRSILSVMGLVFSYFWISLVAILIVAGIAGAHTGNTAPITLIPPSTSAPATQPVQPSQPAASQPATDPSSAPAPAPSAPAPSVSQQSALDSANSYLQNVGGFSRSGLIKQLVFDKFSNADATWAVDHTGADWMAQAAASASSYMKNVGGFSRGSLIDQLTFDGFTYAQAAHGASSVGL